MARSLEMDGEEYVNGEEHTVAKRRRVSEETVLHVKRLSPHAILPKRASPLAAGYDLFR